MVSLTIKQVKLINEVATVANWDSGLYDDNVNTLVELFTNEYVDYFLIKEWEPTITDELYAKILRSFSSTHKRGPKGKITYEDRVWIKKVMDKDLDFIKENVSDNKEQIQRFIRMSKTKIAEALGRNFRVHSNTIYKIYKGETFKEEN